MCWVRFDVLGMQAVETEQSVAESSRTRLGEVEGCLLGALPENGLVHQHVPPYCYAARRSVAVQNADLLYLPLFAAECEPNVLVTFLDQGQQSAWAPFPGWGADSRVRPGWVQRRWWSHLAEAG